MGFKGVQTKIIQGQVMPEFLKCTPRITRDEVNETAASLGVTPTTRDPFDDDCQSTVDSSFINDLESDAATGVITTSDNNSSTGESNASSVVQIPKDKWHKYDASVGKGSPKDTGKFPLLKMPIPVQPLSPLMAFSSSRQCHLV